MNLGEALLELKSMKSELSRLHEARKNSFRFPQGGKPEDGFDSVCVEIAALSEKIRKLKVKVEATNQRHVIDTPEGKTSLAEAIHYIGDMRSELSALESLREKFKNEDSYRWTKDETKYECQISQKELLQKINELEKKKVRMDAFLSSWNWKVDVT